VNCARGSVLWYHYDLRPISHLSPDQLTNTGLQSMQGVGSVPPLGFEEKSLMARRIGEIPPSRGKEGRCMMTSCFFNRRSVTSVFRGNVAVVCVAWD